MSNATPEYDMVVLGTGPAGQKAAIAAAKAGRRVAIVEKKAVVGGTADYCVDTVFHYPTLIDSTPPPLRRN